MRAQANWHCAPKHEVSGFELISMPVQLKDSGVVKVSAYLKSELECCFTYSSCWRWDDGGWCRIHTSCVLDVFIQADNGDNGTGEGWFSPKHNGAALCKVLGLTRTGIDPASLSFSVSKWVVCQYLQALIPLWLNWCAHVITKREHFIDDQLSNGGSLNKNPFFRKQTGGLQSSISLKTLELP